MRKTESAKFSSAGFGLIDFVIIGFVLGLIAFIVITNILAHNY
jgi:F0F1-type ATP synthase assembly protein I